LILSDDLEMAAVRQQWGVDGAALKFLLAGGDLALVCRDAAARDATVAAVGEALDVGELSPEAASAARHRRRVLRAWVDGAAPRPDVGVIGCREHRDLVAEVLGRAGPDPQVATTPQVGD
jgi:beta-glucosidase-like glycosyl hydrolase